MHTFLKLPINKVHRCNPTTSTIVLPRLADRGIAFSGIRGTMNTSLRVHLFNGPRVSNDHHLNITLTATRDIISTVRHTGRTTKRMGMRNWAQRGGTAGVPSHESNILAFAT